MGWCFDLYTRESRRTQCKKLVGVGQFETTTGDGIITTNRGGTAVERRREREESE